MGSREINIEFTNEQIEMYNDKGYRLSFGIGTLSTRTSLTSIKFDQVYALPPTWIDGDISNEKLPGKSFEMVDESSRGASAVLFRRINGQYMPFYVSNPPIESNGSEVLTPKLRVALWLQANAETGAMVSLNRADLSTFDFSGRNQVDLKCNDGQFVAA
ncbi:hypothetical protein NW766_010136 [Fusarium irregulare]|uniref:Uncharacterized protein n=1 Tax=Fusarium irregulare TaxID=2494466 RepID=A0A9W8PIC3_9HYPO|nr:hypothetical protein NW766_010136 [Fusarium irregulare]